MNIKTPDQIAESTVNIGIQKVALSSAGGSLSRLMTLSIAAGAFIALGGILSTVIGSGFPEATAGNPSLQKLLSGMVFPVGLVLVVVLGAELFTGNNALLIPALKRSHYTPSDVLRNWTLVWIGNFIGALIVAVALVHLAGLTTPEPYHTAIIRTAETKANLPWTTVLLRGIGANWCVCLAVWLALSGHTLTEKVVGCWIPVAAFVMLGYEHCVANMFFIPCGMLEGADVDIIQLLWRNLVPATLGNIAGGALFVGMLHGYIRLSGNNEKEKTGKQQ